MSSRQSLPPLREESLSAARRSADALRDRLDLRERLRPYAPLAWTGRTRGAPTLHLEDISAIPFVRDVPGIEEYQHRARVRAADGDVFATVTQPVEGYEPYCRDTLRLGTPQIVLAPPCADPLRVAMACSEGPPFERLVELARSRGLCVHPYMAIEDVWELAALVAAAGAIVEVLGPPPPVTWIANDKALFSAIVAGALGEDWVVETHVSSSIDTLAAAMVATAERHRRVGVKRTRCASAMGNAVFLAADLRAMDAAHVRETLRAFLDRTQWPAGEEVLVVAWEETDLSPSTQLWIPPLGQGDPVLEGIYEQILEGPSKVFVGSRPSTLPAAVDEAMGRASLLVGAALQELGYVGRCSFDLLVVGDPAGDFTLRFAECNGRWGGTSTPMHLVDRVSPGSRPTYRAQDVMHEGLRGARFTDVEAALGDTLWSPTNPSGRFILYNVGPLAGRGKLDVIAFGASPDDADEAMLSTLPRRLGLA